MPGAGQGSQCQRPWARALLSRQDTGAAQGDGSLRLSRSRQAQRHCFPWNSVSTDRMGWGGSQQSFIQPKGGYGFPLSLAMETALSGQIQTAAPEIPY